MIKTAILENNNTSIWTIIMEKKPPSYLRIVYAVKGVIRTDLLY